MPSTSSPVTDPAARLTARKARLQSLRERARDRYVSGAPGLQVAALISEMIDRLIVELFEESLTAVPEGLRESLRRTTAIIAVGGSGRGELCPFSDADLLFVQRRDTPAPYAAIVSQLVRDCWDSGIKLGHSVRSIADAMRQAREDPQFATSLVEMRPIWGDEGLCESLRTRFQSWVRRNRGAFFRNCVRERGDERSQFGESARALEPDIKRGAGGLRDIHLIRWAGFACYGTGDPDLLRMEGAMSREDYDRLREAHEYFTRIRVELHFHAGRAHEVLSRSEQMRLAELYGYEDGGGQRGVERFMQAYFRHATAVSDITQRFIARHRPVSLAQRLEKWFFSHRSNRWFAVGRHEIDVLPAYRSHVCARLDRIVQLFELSGLYSVAIAPALIEQIKLAVPNLTHDGYAEAGQRFLSILKRPGRIGIVLRGMFATGVLEQVVPEFAHVRCLMQFNQYHSFTVDEHTLRAVEAAESFEKDAGPLGEAYRSIKRKELLHLSLLLHDLGKGYEEDHSDVGKRIAEAVGFRMKLPQGGRETIAFLVHKHLAMTNFAFRRDLTDAGSLASFARDIGSPELLTLLYCHTAADMTAVGPGVWTDWKAGLIAELYERVLSALGSDHGPAKVKDRVDRVVGRVRDAYRRAMVAAHGPKANAEAVDLEPRVREFPEHYLLATPAEQIARDIEVLERVPLEGVVVTGVWAPETGTVEYRVYCRDTVGSGIFSKVAGALTAQRLDILTAEICTTVDGYVMDGFRVTDSDFTGEIPRERIEAVEATVKSVLAGEVSVESLLSRGRRFDALAREQLIREQTRVVIDNTTSERFTIIDIFAHDCPGLLYRITATLLSLNLSVSRAKIATHVDQVVDVFYVTDRDGAKVTDEARLGTVQTVLCHRIEELESQSLRAAHVGTETRVERVPGGSEGVKKPVG